MADIDVWAEWLLNEYTESRGNASSFFSDLYREYDKNQVCFVESGQARPDLRLAEETRCLRVCQ